MKKKKPYKKPRRQHQPRRQEDSNLPQVGDLVYCHAYVNPKDETTYFLCKGYIVRQPVQQSPVYKVIITSVDPKSVLCGERPDLAKVLLGRKIARKPDQITEEPTGWMSKLYEGHGWLDVNPQELKKIQDSLKRKKKEDKK